MANKLFLGGVAHTTTKEDLSIHFSAYGTVLDAVVMYGKEGQHRGFGFVTLEEDEAVNAVLAEPQVIHDKTIDVKRAVPGSEAPPPRGANGMAGDYGHSARMALAAVPSRIPSAKGSGPATDKVFVGGLPQSVNEDMLSEYFGRYGALVDIVVMKDRMTNKPRGFGFVRYDSTGPVEQVMADYDVHTLEGKWIEVKRAVPQDEMTPTLGGKPVAKGGAWGGKSAGKGGKGCKGCKGGWGGGGFGGGYGGGFGGGYGGGYGGGCGGGYGGGFPAMAPRPYAAPAAFRPQPSSRFAACGGTYPTAGGKGGGKGGFRSQPY